MKNELIKYDLSNDYAKLYELLKKENVIIGFIALDIKGVPSMDHSKLTAFPYEPKYGLFNLGFSFFEADFDKISFYELCKKYNVRYLPFKS